MRMATLILGIVGGLIAGGLGLKWLGDIGQLNEIQRMAGGEQLRQMGIAGILLVGSLVAGVAGGILSYRRNFVLGAALMLIGAILPLFYASQAVIFTLPLLIGGVLAIAAHFKGSRPTLAA
jgi:hypothetical protein